MMVRHSKEYQLTIEVVLTEARTNESLQNVLNGIWYEALEYARIKKSSSDHSTLGMDDLVPAVVDLLPEYIAPSACNKATLVHLDQLDELAGQIMIDSDELQDNLQSKLFMQTTGRVLSIIKIYCAENKVIALKTECEKYKVLLQYNDDVVKHINEILSLLGQEDPVSALQACQRYIETNKQSLSYGTDSTHKLFWMFLVKFFEGVAWHLGLVSQVSRSSSEEFVERSDKMLNSEELLPEDPELEALLSDNSPSPTRR